MIKTLRHIFFMALCAAPLLFGLFNCARESRPTGGLKDTIAPFALRERPHNGAVNQQQLRKIRVDFNEFITLKNPTETCIISPPLNKPPKVDTRKKSLTINLKGIDLQDSTTYSFTFTNGIADVNEGNILNQYTYAFSTGATIDTLQISGKVMNAETAEVSKTAFVLLYNNNLNDSAVMTKKPNYVTQVRNDGTFTLKNVAAGEYRIYALEEQNRDFMFNSPDEKIAFHEEIISPRAERFIDTTWFFRAGDTLKNNIVRLKDSISVAEKDSFSIAEKTRFLPEKLELTVFRNQAQTIDVIANKRVNRYAWGMRFSTAVTAEDYTVQIPNFAENAFRIDQVSADSVLLWLRDTALISATDAKIIVQRKQMNDTILRTDTFALAPVSAIPERLQITSVPEKPLLFSGDSLHISTSRPIAYLQSDRFQLYSLRDSFALWSSKGKVLVKNAEEKYDVECSQRIAPEFQPKLFYEKQKILSQRLGTNRCALYFAKPFNMSDVQISLKAYPNLQNWYVSQYDAESNALLLWFTHPDVRVLKNPILEVTFPEDKDATLKKETISFSKILTEKDRIKSPKNGRLLLAIEKSQEKSFFIDNTIEIVCNNPIAAVQDSLIRMVDLRDTSKISVVTRCEISKTEPRKLLIFHNAQPGKSFLITLEKNALTDIFGNTSRQGEFSTNAQGETTTPYFTKEEFAIVRNDSTLRNFSATAKWKEDTKYALVLSPHAVLDIYDDHSDSTQIQFSSPLLENYGELAVQLTNVEHIVLELLPAKAKIAEVKYTAYELKENTIVFTKIEPGSYNLRAFIDVNNNKRWDTGSLQLQRKAEKRLLYKTPVEIKAGKQTNVKWDTSTGGH